MLCYNNLLLFVLYFSYCDSLNSGLSLGFFFIIILGKLLGFAYVVHLFTNSYFFLVLG